MIKKAALISLIIILFNACSYTGSEKTEEPQNKMSSAKNTFETIDLALVVNATTDISQILN